MPDDLDKYRPRIKDYLTARGIEVRMVDGNERFQCLGHDDNKPSAIVYPEKVFCPVCATSWGIFDLAGLLIHSQDFKAQLEDVKVALGDLSDAPAAKPKHKPKAPQEVEPVKLSIKEAREIFTREALESLGVKAKWGTHLVAVWPYVNASGDVEIVDARFEGGTKPKAVVSCYWDGKSIRTKGAPIRVYAADRLAANPVLPALVVEGAKAAKIAQEALGDAFVVTTWNRGTGSVGKADWSVLGDRRVYVWCDDDDPGRKVGLWFAQNTSATIVSIPRDLFKDMRALKPKGADIVEALECRSAAELREIITNPAPPQEPPSEPEETSDDRKIPFRALGVADNGKGYFIDRGDRVLVTPLESITDGKLLRLAPLPMWLSWRGVNKLTKDDWLEIKDELIELCIHADFDLDNLRGRGAWREPDGRICFHDGKTTIGEWADKRVFLKKPPVKYGLDHEPPTAETIKNMKDAAFALSFENTVDAVRLLAWASLAPFSGALPWRPQAMLTGRSGSGKSSIEYHVVRPLAMPVRMNGGETSGAGYIQSRNKDAGAVTIEEVETDTEKKRRYREELFSVMRQSTSDDTPMGYKGTADQVGTSYMTRDMILFVAISPEVESIADENRLSMINTKRPDNGKTWKELRTALGGAFTDENCQAVRAAVWRRLRDIIELADTMASHIQDVTGRDHRFAISESMLLSTYLLVWKQMEGVGAEDIDRFLHAMYDGMEQPEERDEASEMIDSLLSERVKVFGERQKEMTLYEILVAVKTGKIEAGDRDGEIDGMRDLRSDELVELRKTAGRHGVGLYSGDLAIASNHKEVKRILGKMNGYAKILGRSPMCVDRSYPCTFAGKQQRGVVISGVLPDDENPL
jgi:hypothetical protein